MPLPEYGGGGLAAAIWDGADPELLLVVGEAGGWLRAGGIPAPGGKGSQKSRQKSRRAAATGDATLTAQALLCLLGQEAPCVSVARPGLTPAS